MTWLVHDARGILGLVCKYEETEYIRRIRRARMLPQRTGKAIRARFSGRMVVFSRLRSNETNAYTLLDSRATLSNLAVLWVAILGSSAYWRCIRQEPLFQRCYRVTTMQTAKGVVP